MDLIKMKNELSVRFKNGITFLLAATIIWTIITIIFLQHIDIRQKNIFMLYSTGLMFPLAYFLSKILKVDWNSQKNPVGTLGMYLNITQLIYFPIIFWAFIKSPAEMVLFFAIITGAHLFPYGWVYNTKVYYVLSPVITLLIFGVYFFLGDEDIWIIPITMVIFLIVLNILLYFDYKKKVYAFSQKASNFTNEEGNM